MCLLHLDGIINKDGRMHRLMQKLRGFNLLVNQASIDQHRWIRSPVAPTQWIHAGPPPSSAGHMDSCRIDSVQEEHYNNWGFASSGVDALTFAGKTMSSIVLIFALSIRRSVTNIGGFIMSQLHHRCLNLVKKITLVSKLAAYIKLVP